MGRRRACALRAIRCDSHTSLVRCCWLTCARVAVPYSAPYMAPPGGLSPAYAPCIGAPGMP